MNALLIGLRMVVVGGRSARLRAALTAVGVAAGVVMLLVAASVPNIIASGDARAAARETGLQTAREPGPTTLLVTYAATEFRDAEINGRNVEAEGPRAPAPPGLDRLPAPGEMFVSPELAALLTSPEGRLLRERFDARVVGTIGDAGLRGPRELYFYRGVDDIPAGAVARRTGVGERISGWGYDYEREPLPAYFVFIVVVGVVVMLLPVAIFVATAVRFGGEERDRRLAALRLVGADRLMTARVAAGEALAGALGGLALGAALFAAIRPLMERISLQDLSVYAADVTPSPGLALLVVVGVPVSAVLVSVAAMRRVAIEPLGVVRQGTAGRRRVGWRVAPIAVGGLLLALMAGDLRDPSADFSEAQVSLGVVLVLAGVTALLPWLVEVVVRRLRGGTVAAQLAIRRLQLDSALAARVVSGVAVAVAGAIALQTILATGQRESVFATGADPTRAQAFVGAGAAGGLTAETMRVALEGATGVRQALTSTLYPRRATSIRVGSCEALREYARIGTCAPGDAFLAGVGRTAAERARVDLPPSTRVVGTRPSPMGYADRAVLATPEAVPAISGRAPQVEALLRFDPAEPDAIEHARNAAAALSGEAYVSEVEPTTELAAYRTVRRGVYAAAVAVLLLIGASLLIGGLEQLRERRPVLAAMAAFGTPRRVMARSVLWQAAVPVGLGVAVASVIGVGLGALLIRIGGRSVDIDWSAVVAMAAAGGAVILLVTALTLPALIRLSRPVGLRAE